MALQAHREGVRGIRLLADRADLTRRRSARAAACSCGSVSRSTLDAWLAQHPDERAGADPGARGATARGHAQLRDGGASGARGAARAHPVGARWRRRLRRPSRASLDAEADLARRIDAATSALADASSDAHRRRRRRSRLALDALRARAAAPRDRTRGRSHLHATAGRGARSSAQRDRCCSSSASRSCSGWVTHWIPLRARPRARAALLAARYIARSTRDADDLFGLSAMVALVRRCSS